MSKQPADWDGAIVRHKGSHRACEVVGVSESGRKLYVVPEGLPCTNAGWRRDVELVPVTNVTHVAVDGSWEPL